MMKKLGGAPQNGKRMTRTRNVRPQVTRGQKPARRKLEMVPERAEEFRKELNISKEEYQRRVCERLCLKCGRKGHYVGDCKGNSSSA